MATREWRLPPRPTRRDGAMRRAGFEMEFQGVPLAELEALVAATLDGDAEPLSRAESLVRTGLGDFRVEIDHEALKRYARARAEERAEDETAIDRLALDLLTELSTLVVPCELVTPPLRIDRLAETLEPLTQALHEAGAKGTGHSFIYAFGLHINAEAPELDARTLAAYLKSFVLLFDWLQWTEAVDVSRRATTYVSRYPADYELLLADPAYWPGLDALIDDYLHFNPTRNRALDMLPLFAEIDDARVRDKVDDPRVAARPAFHYRLANCRIDEPGWSIEEHWQRWLAVEALAGDEDKLAAASKAFLADRRRVLHLVDSEWRRKSEQWIDPPSSA